MDDLSDGLICVVASSPAAHLLPLHIRLCSALCSTPARHHSGVLSSVLTSKPARVAASIDIRTSTRQLQQIYFPITEFLSPELTEGLEATWQAISACDPACEALHRITWLHVTLPAADDCPTHEAQAVTAVLQRCTALRDLTITDQRQGLWQGRNPRQAADNRQEITGNVTALTAVLQGLPSVQTLQSVRLTTLDLTPEQWHTLQAALVQLPDLRALELCPAETDYANAAGTSHIARLFGSLPGLAHIILARSPRHPPVIALTVPLVLPGLKSASLYSSALCTAAAQPHLSKCPHLRHLHIYKKSLGSSVAYLNRALASLSASTLCKLAIEDTMMPADAKGIALFGELIAAQPALTAVTLVRPFACTGLQEAVHPLASHVVQAIAACTALQHLHLDLLLGPNDTTTWQEVGPALLDLPARLPQLVSLTLLLRMRGKFSVPVSLLSRLLRHPALEELTVQVHRWCASQEGADDPNDGSALGGMRCLPVRVHTLNVAPIVDDGGHRRSLPLGLLPALQSLRTLRLDLEVGRLIDDLLNATATTQAVLPLLTQLRELKISGWFLPACVDCQPELGPTLPAGLTGLQLSVGFTHARYQPARSDGAGNQRLGTWRIGVFLQAAELPQLQWLDVSSTQMLPEDADAIAAAVAATQPALTQLDLSRNADQSDEYTFGDAGADALAKRLLACKALRRLDLTGQGCTDAALLRLQHALPAVVIAH